MKLTISLLVIPALFSSVFGDRNGVDVLSTAVLSEDAAQCLQNKVKHNEDNFLYSYLNIRMSNSSGYIRSAMDTMQNALNNINHIDVLIEICPKKVQQTGAMVSDILGKLQNAQGNPLNKLQRVWISAMLDADCWYTSGSDDDVNKNMAALNASVHAIQAQNKGLGIKTNVDNWTALSNDWDGMAADGAQLWWTSEGPASFDGFEPFGGWRGTPALRQFQMGATKCQSPVNLNIVRDDVSCQGDDQDCDEGCCSDQWGDCGCAQPGKCPGRFECV